MRAHHAGRPAGKGTALLLLSIFFLSGFAALLYQMIWQRLLTFFGGADVYSVTLIVSAFMAGLGSGSLAGGQLADKLSLRGRLRAFAFAELAIAAFAFVSVPLFYDGLYLGLGERPLPGPVTALVLFVALLWPTFLMGLSLPLLAKTFAPADRRPEDWVAQLYGFNTLGAAAGALVTVWVLVRAFGFERCVEIGAVANLACGLVGLLLARHASAEAPALPAAGAAATPVPTATFTWPVWLLVYTLSGYVALSLEIVWFRLLGVILKSNSFTFATLLALFLAGVGLGALLGSRWARRSRRPALAFLLFQAAVPVYAALALALFVACVGVWPPTYELAAHLAAYEPPDIGKALRILERFVAAFGQLAPHALDSLGFYATLYVLVPLALIGPATLLMGLSFPFLQKAAQTDETVLGRRVGSLQAANILGSTLGAALTGALLLQVLGSAWTLRLLVLLGGIFLFLAARVGVTRPGPRRAAAFGAWAAVICVALLSPAPGRLWATLHGTEPAHVIVAEDASGLAVLRDQEYGGVPHTVMLSNGIGQGLLPYGRYHTMLGAFPALLHPAPRRIAIVGLGSGDTLFGAAGREETGRIDCIEIVAAQFDTLQLLARRRPYPGLGVPLTDGRVRYAFTDGRAFLMRTDERYDVIEADALLPNAAFAGSLYSREYFDLMRRRLAPGGFAVSWAPTARTRDTFVQVFPHVLFIADVLVGSETPIAFERAAVFARLRVPFTRAYYRRGGVDIEALAADFLSRPERVWGPDSERAVPRDVNHDLFPRDEYMVPRAAGGIETPGVKLPH